MHAHEINHLWRRGWLSALALLSLAVPVTAALLRSEPAVPSGDPARLSYYRQVIAAIGVGLVFAAAAFVSQRAPTSALIRRTSIVLASLGLLTSMYLLWTLIGTCGLEVIWGQCNP